VPFFVGTDFRRGFFDFLRFPAPERSIFLLTNF